MEAKQPFFGNLDRCMRSRHQTWIEAFELTKSAIASGKQHTSVRSRSIELKNMEYIKEFFFSIYESIVYMTFDYYQYTIPIFVAFWVILKNRLAHFRIQPKPRNNARRILREIRNNIITFGVMGATTYLLFFHNREWLFYNNIYTDIDDYGWFYLVFSVFGLLFLDDMQFYWLHRWMHQPRIYPYVHKVHHLTVDPDPFTTFSFHPWEAAVQVIGQVLATSIIPVHPLALAIYAPITLVNSLVIHLGYEIYPKWMTKFWLTKWKTPCTHHNLHHDRGKGNYSLIFTWWDKWMGTEHPEYEERLEAVQQRKLGSRRGNVNFDFD